MPSTVAATLAVMMARAKRGELAVVLAWKR
jgi:hypothetical protein